MTAARNRRGRSRERAQRLLEAPVGFERTNGGFADPYAFRYPRTRTGTFLCGLALMVVSASAGELLIPGTPKSARAPI